MADFVLRSALALPVLAVAVAVWCPKALGALHAPGWVVLRSLLLVIMWVSYYAALPHQSSAVAAAAYYTLPLFITLISALITQDRIPPLGWVAVVLGFIGVLLILRPDASGFNGFALLPVLAAILYAVAMVQTRSKCRREHPLMLALVLHVAFIVAGGVATVLTGQVEGQGFLFDPWAAIDRMAWMSMAVMSLAAIVGSVGAAIAYQLGPPSVIGTFDFAYVGFAVVWGVLFFADVPDLVTVLGMTLIVVAGILSLRH